MNKQIFIAVLILVFCVAACRSNVDAPPRPVAVDVKKVIVAGSFDDFAYSGTIEESQTLPHSFPVPGTVTKVLVAEGDAVQKGQLLATLDATSHKNSHDMAQAAAVQAEDAYKRLERMYKKGNLAEIKYVEIETKLQQARAAAAIAKKNLDDCRLYATASGKVGKRAIEPGMVAMPNVTSITIVKIDKVFARVAVPENEIPAISKGQKARVKIGALDMSFDGVIEEAGVVADPLSRTYPVKIGIANAGNQIKPGMVCSVTLANTRVRQVPVVPGEAVLVDETGRNFVYAVDAAKNIALRKFVKAGKIVPSGIEIVEGLQGNELVVTAGQHKLTDQAPVQMTQH